MRHIVHRHAPDDAAWIAKATQILAQLGAAPDAATRNAIIKTNKAVCGEIKQWLLSLSHQKCWFSEAKDCFSHWDVEHYRPKKSARDADGTEHEGYWWLAFDWHNLRICGNVGNRKKSTYFPLRVGCPRCAPHGDLRHEDPQLLDPVDPEDPALISFNLEGRAIPAPDVTDGLGEVSRRVFGGAVQPRLSAAHGQTQGGMGELLGTNTAILEGPSPVSH
jgi:hypothetical protein